MDDLIVSGPEAAPLILLAHGAGADCQSPFMTTMAQLLAAHGVRTARFDFSYMGKRKTDGKRRPPPAAELLVPEMMMRITQASALAFGEPLFIGGKSMGGRIASLVGEVVHQEGRVAGCVCLGYPFHPAGKPQRPRIAHLAEIECPLLIVQGCRDPLGSASDAAGYRLSDNIDFEWLADGDHDFKPRRSSGRTHQQNLEAAAVAVSTFIERHSL